MLRESTDNDAEPSLNSIFENPSIDATRKMFAFYALKHREEVLPSSGIGIMLVIQHPVRM